MPNPPSKGAQVIDLRREIEKIVAGVMEFDQREDIESLCRRYRDEWLEEAAILIANDCGKYYANLIRSLQSDSRESPKE